MEIQEFTIKSTDGDINIFNNNVTIMADIDEILDEIDGADIAEYLERNGYRVTFDE